MNLYHASLLRKQIRYKRNHICLFPKYVVEDRSTLRKFRVSDAPAYLYSKVKDTLAHLAK